MGWGEDSHGAPGRAESAVDELAHSLPSDFLVFRDRGFDASRILVPTAGGPASDLSGAVARMLQAEFGGEVTLLHVADDEARPKGGRSSPSGPTSTASRTRPCGSRARRRRGVHRARGARRHDAHRRRDGERAARGWSAGRSCWTCSTRWSVPCCSRRSAATAVSSAGCSAAGRGRTTSSRPTRRPPTPASRRSVDAGDRRQRRGEVRRKSAVTRADLAGGNCL